MQNAKRYAIIIGVVVLVLLIGGLVLATIFNVLLETVYIFLMILAALLIAATAFQIYSIIMLMRTISTVREEVKPLVSSVNETVGIVKETVQTAGHAVSTLGSTMQLTKETALAPSVRAVASVVAGQQLVRVFFGKGHVASKNQQRRKQQMEALARSK